MSAMPRNSFTCVNESDFVRVHGRRACTAHQCAGNSAHNSALTLRPLHRRGRSTL
jgi:hypothetical protein